MPKVCKHCNLFFIKGDICEKCGAPLAEVHEIAKSQQSKSQIIEHQQAVNAISTKQSEGCADEPTDINADQKIALQQDNKATLEVGRIEDNFAVNVKQPLKKRAATIESIDDSVFAALDIPKIKLSIGKAEKTSLAIILFVLVILVALPLVYLNVSAVHVVAIAPAEQNEDIYLSAIQNSLNDNRFEHSLSAAQFNRFVIDNVDRQVLKSVLGERVEALHYDAQRQLFVARLRGKLLNTSLLFDLESVTSGAANQFTITNTKLGNWQIPVMPQIAKLLAGRKHNTIGISDKIITISGLDYTDQISIKGEISQAYFNDLANQIEAENERDYLNFIIKNKNVSLPGLEHLHLYDAAMAPKIKPFLLALTGQQSNIFNWLVLLDVQRANSIVSDIDDTFIWLALPEDGAYNSKLEQLRIECQMSYHEYLGRHIAVDLASVTTKVYNAVKTLHDESGVPNYVVSNGGRPYSLTLAKYITKDSLNIDIADDYDIFALGEKLLVGKQVNTEYWYYTIDHKGELGKLENRPDKRLILSDIKYQKTNNGKAKKLVFNAIENKKIIAAVEKYLKVEKGLYNGVAVRYLAATEQEAFVICSPSDNTQVIYQYLLFADTFDRWQVTKEIGPDQSMLSSLQQQIIDQSFDTTILPPYDVVDFKMQPYQAEQIDEIKNYLTARGLIATDATIDYFSRVNDNLYLTAAEHKILIIFKLDSFSSYNHMYDLANVGSVDKYFSSLKALQDYPKYLPTFVFTQ